MDLHKKAEVSRYSELMIQGDTHSIFGDVRFYKSFCYVLYLLRRAGIDYGVDILELGCGFGSGSFLLQKSGYKVTSFDIAYNAVLISQENCREDQRSQHVRFFVADAERLPLCHEFDAAIMTDTLHHCRAWESVVSNVFKIIRPGGCFILVEPNWFHQFSPFARGAIKAWGITEQGMSRRHLRAVMRRAGFTKIINYYPWMPAYRPCSTSVLEFVWHWAGVFFSRVILFPGFGIIILCRK